MENQDLDLIGQTVGNMPYKVGITDENGKLANQFVVNTSTNRIDIPQAILEQNQLPPAVNLFSGSAVGDILLSGPSANYDNIQDGLLITLSNLTSDVDKYYSGFSQSVTPSNVDADQIHFDLSSLGLQKIKIPKEKLVVNSSFDFSAQLSQYIGKAVQGYYFNKDTNSWSSFDNRWTYTITSFGGATIKVLPNATLNINLTVTLKGSIVNFESIGEGTLPIPVIQVNDYKN